MAWVAKLNSAVVKDADSFRIVADIVYYDDIDAQSILHRRMFFFDPGTSGAQMQQTIRDEGVAARTAFNRATTINGQFPSGSTLSIP